jgi:hypothetical protein
LIKDRRTRETRCSQESYGITDQPPTKQYKQDGIPTSQIIELKVLIQAEQKTVGGGDA